MHAEEGHHDQYEAVTPLAEAPLRAGGGVDLLTTLELVPGHANQPTPDQEQATKNQDSDHIMGPDPVIDRLNNMVLPLMSIVLFHAFEVTTHDKTSFRSIGKTLTLLLFT